MHPTIPPNNNTVNTLKIPHPHLHNSDLSSNLVRLEAAMAQLTRTISIISKRQIQADKKMDAIQEEARSNIWNQGAAISKLEAQLGSRSKEIPMPTHTFPSDTIANLRGECKAITLRSGKVIDEAFSSHNEQEEDAASGSKSKKEEETPEPLINHYFMGYLPPPLKQVLKPYVPNAPYPQRLKKDGKHSQFSRFFEIFKKLQINIPFTEALEQMPLYTKFLKELMIRKRIWGEKETVVLTEEYTIIQKKLRQKLNDPGSFQIPCIIGDISIEKALCDLRDSINLMSLAMMKRMRIEEAKPTRMALQLADRTFKFPHGVVEDLLVKVEEFIFLADFVVLDMEAKANTSIILGRPFLATAGAIIDVQKGELVLRLHKEKMVFNVFKAMNYPKESIGECMMVDTIENLVQGVLEEEQCKEIKEQDRQGSCGELPLETMDESIMMDKTSKMEVEAPKLELKTLPPSLKYAYLGDNNTYPVIINSSLNEEQEEE
ncbi:uncharacterized protein LOC107483169 [Arachis duranensis]|uniref:Uncharacterized protein LOC107483169 n=1 Tax=Arachis duranensis TaxID=130453 RepID=A0A6P4CZ03_ARADU|nr:uncharacterized protein LOC107483169 [Arachis duranensis]